MNRAKVALVLVAGVIGLIQSGCAGTSGDSENPFDAEKWVGEWVNIWNTYDLDRIDELFLQDDRLTYFSSEKEGAIFGIDAVRDHHEGFGFVSGGKEQPNKLWVEDLHSVDFDAAAVVTGIWYFERGDGSRQRGPVTILYVRQGHRFRIAHMNFANYQDEKK